MALTKCGKLSEIESGSGTLVTINGQDIALFNVNGTVYACSNTCAHQGGPLSEGALQGTTITCPWHSWKYDVTTGVCAFNPAIKISTFKTTLKGDDIFVEV